MGRMHYFDESNLEQSVVNQSDFNAQTILAATADDTPLALTIAEQTLVGRITGGNVAALTVAQIKTMLAYIASDIGVSELGSATYDDIQDYINFFGDRTILTGGAISDNGDGTATVASGTAWAKETDSETAIGRFFDFSADASVSLTNLVTNHVYLDYNGGTPQIVVSTDILTHGLKQDHILLGHVFRNGTTLHLHNEDALGIGRMGRINLHHLEHDGVQRSSGMVTTSVGTRNLGITTGVLYDGISRHTTVPFTTPNSGTADATEANKLHDADGGFASTDVGKTVHNTTDDTYAAVTAFVDSGELTLDADIFISGENYDLDIFSYWYTADSGSTWTEVPGATQISRTQYNNIAAGLASLNSNRFGVHWLYMDMDGHDIHVVYGQGDYKANEAEEAGVPSTLPDIVVNYCVLIAKVICQEGTDTLTISLPWTTVFHSSLATDHNALANLTTGDVHTQYVKHALATAANDFLVASGSGAYVKKTLAETLTIISPLTTRGDIMFRNATVSTRLAKGADNTILAMGANDPEWKTPATILADLSGQAGAAFDWGGQNLTNLGSLAAFTLAGTVTVNGQTFDCGAGSTKYITTGSAVGVEIEGPHADHGPGFKYTHTDTTPTVGNWVGRQDFWGYDGAGTPALMIYGILGVLHDNVTDGAEAGKLFFQLATGGGQNTPAFSVTGAGEGFFDTNVLVDEFVQVTEMAAPGAGGANTARIYAIVDGGALTDLAAVFQDGTVDIFAQETTPLDAPVFRYASKTEGKLQLRKPHPGKQIVEMVFPDGSTFVLKEIEHHDAEKVAASVGSEGPLPSDWVVNTLQERRQAQFDILEPRLANAQAALSRAKDGLKKARKPEDKRIIRSDIDRWEQEIDRTGLEIQSELARTR